METVPRTNPFCTSKALTAPSASARSFSSTADPRFSRDAEMICAGVNRFTPATTISETRGSGRRKKRRSTFPSVSRVNAETSRKTDFSYNPRIDARTASLVRRSPGRTLMSPASST